MDIKEIKQIIELMKRSDLTEFEIEEEQFKLRIARSTGHTSAQVTPPQSVPAPALLEGHAIPGAQLAAPAQPKPEDDKSIGFVKSPMVGTFYRAPTPESAPFCEPGSKVTSETVVCIIEAMKVMNEIQAEIGGTVLEVLVENGEPVEFGQPLFKVRLN